MTTTPYTVVLRKNSNHSFGIYIGEDVPSGIYIVTIEANSPAANANIQPGDHVLAVNGQLVSSMSRNPKEMIIKIANKSESLTLSIQPSNLLKTIDSLLNNHFYDDNYRYISQQNNGINRDLENYIKSILCNENLHIIPSLTSNHNEYILTSDPYSSRPHRHRKRRSVKKAETQTSIIDGQKENMQSLSQQRSIPSMGTSHVILRNSQLSSKDNEINEVPETKSLPNIQSTINNSDFNINEKANRTSEPIFPPQQSFNPPPPQFSNNRVVTFENLQTPLLSNRPTSNNNNGFREVRLHRSPNFEGFGFHLQYNTYYYIINQVEHNSPAEKSGLRNNDVVCKVNNQSTDKMNHDVFVRIINESEEIILLVQTYDDFIRTNPKLVRQQNNRPIMETTVNNNNKKDDDKRPNVFSKALTKLTSR